MARSLVPTYSSLSRGSWNQRSVTNMAGNQAGSADGGGWKHWVSPRIDIATLGRRSASSRRIGGSCTGALCPFKPGARSEAVSGSHYFWVSPGP